MARASSKTPETQKTQFPRFVDEAIAVVRMAGVDPANFYSTAQECFNRGLGIAGQWILDHEDTYLAGVKSGYELVPEHPVGIVQPKVVVEAEKSVVDEEPTTPAEEPVETIEVDANPDVETPKMDEEPKATGRRKNRE